MMVDSIPLSDIWVRVGVHVEDGVKIFGEHACPLQPQWQQVTSFDKLAHSLAEKRNLLISLIMEKIRKGEDISRLIQVDGFLTTVSFSAARLDNKQAGIIRYESKRFWGYASLDRIQTGGTKFEEVLLHMASFSQDRLLIKMPERQKPHSNHLLFQDFENLLGLMARDSRLTLDDFVQKLIDKVALDHQSDQACQIRSILNCSPVS